MDGLALHDGTGGSQLSLDLFEPGGGCSRSVLAEFHANDAVSQGYFILLELLCIVFCVTFQAHLNGPLVPEITCSCIALHTFLNPRPCLNCRFEQRRHQN